MRYFGPRRDRSNPPGVLLDADFSASTAGSYSGLPTFGLTLTRASAATVRTALATIAAGLGVNVARIYDDGTARGLLIEEARTNYMPRSNELGVSPWVAGQGTVTANVGVAPDGTTTADREQLASGQYGSYQAVTLSSGTYTMSEWVKESASPGGWAMHMRMSGGVGVLVSKGGVATSTWTRHSVTAAHTGGICYPAAVDGRDLQTGFQAPGVAAGARDCLVSHMQLENGSFPSSFIETAGSTATRAADYLYHSNFSALVSSGRLHVYFCLYPLCASSEMGAGVLQLLENNAGACYANINGPDRHLYIGINGAAVDIGALPSWVRHDRLEIYIAAGGGVTTTVAKARVNAGMVTTLTTGAPQGVIATGTGRVDFLSHQTSARQFSAAANRIAVFDGTTLPGSWAA